MAKQTRGVRNNNPGNLRKTADPWQGLADNQPDSEFFAFKTAAWGIRALAVTLITYQDRHGLRTVAKIIKRWAPPSENDTRAYVGAVSAFMGVAATTPINVHDYGVMRPLVEAIIHHENAGYRYPRDVIDSGLAMAGIVAKKPAVAARSSAPATVAAGAGGVAATVGAIVQNVSPALPLVQQLADAAPYLVLGAVLAGLLVYGVWRWRRNRKIV